VLLYAADRQEGPKSSHAIAVVEALAIASRAATSPQIVAEFVSATTSSHRGPPILSRRQALLWAGHWLRNTECLELSPGISREALRIFDETSLSIYDAQICATALRHGIDTVVTEDLPGNRTLFQGIRYVNPFAASFSFGNIGL
jgi:predicted nucleic acid-binding protein